MVITEPDLLSGKTRVMDPALLGQENMQDVFELRLVLEVGMADLLFAQKTAKDLIETLENGTAADFRRNVREHLTPHYEQI